MGVAHLQAGLLGVQLASLGLVCGCDGHDLPLQSIPVRHHALQLLWQIRAV